MPVNAQHVTQMKGFEPEPPAKNPSQTVWDLQANADKAAAKAAKEHEPAPADTAEQPDVAPAEQEN